MKDYVRLTANAGVLIVCGRVKLLLDALHQKRTRFSGVSEALAGRIVAGEGDFSDIGYFLVTHDHPDHYDPDLMRQFQRNHLETKLLTPTSLSGNGVFSLREERQQFDFGDVRIRCQRLKHDGEKYAHIVNYGFVVSVCGRNMLMLGDATFDGEGIEKLIGGDRIDTAFLNFPFVTLLRGKKIVREIIRPRQDIVFHLPFAEDDTERYLETTRYIAKKDADTMPQTVLLCREDQAAELIPVPNA